jgi:hypothetical protein
LVEITNDSDCEHVETSEIKQENKITTLNTLCAEFNAELLPQSLERKIIEEANPFELEVWI